jgi:REP element-mobilizing transposase RayT
MTRYRRNFLPGGRYFFTVNLADRRLWLLIEHIDLLRAAFRQTRVTVTVTVYRYAVTVTVYKTGR